MSITRVLTTSGIIVLTGASALLGYRYIRADVASSLYRDRLAMLAGDYETLRDRYNEAVRKTAVTEVVVKGKTLSVRIRTPEGLVDEIPTPFDPRGEIFIDYVVLDGRLWIRRVFDEKTAPGDALVIDPKLASIDWSRAAHGKAVYRTLSEGRWVITVSGDGALALARGGDAVDLQPAPAIKSYNEAEAEADDVLRKIGFVEVWSRFFRGE